MRKKRILLADDDDAVRQRLGRELRIVGYDVIVAATGRAAASWFAVMPPDLVLFDLDLPEWEGRTDFELVCALHPQIPVIGIGARSHEKARAVQMGADEHRLMEKPLDLPGLVAAIRMLLGGSDPDPLPQRTRPDFKIDGLDASRQSTSEVLAL